MNCASALFNMLVVCGIIQRDPCFLLSVETAPQPRFSQSLLTFRKNTCDPTYKNELSVHEPWSEVGIRALA